MPRRSIENVKLSAITDGAFVEGSVSTVNPIPSIRVYFVYNSPWWRGRRYLSPHHMTTDLPIHRTMDFGSQGYSVMDEFSSHRDHSFSHVDLDRFGVAPDHQYVLMVSDIDGPNTAYLEYIFPTETTYEKNITRYASTVKDITQQLARLYRLTITQVPQPVAIIAKDWTQSPSGAGWDFWKRGINWLHHAKRMLKPVGWEDMYVVGSSYCSGTCQVYAEGALQTVEMLLKWFPL